MFLVVNIRLWAFFLVTKLIPSGSDSLGAVESVTLLWYVPRVEVEVAC